MKKQILIIEDVIAWINVYKNILNNYSIIVANSFECALQKINEKPYDLIILDNRLDINNNENVDGLILLQIIRKQNKTIPIVIVSAYPELLKKEIIDNNKPNVIINKKGLNIIKFKKAIDDLLIS